jgi:Flp pilus assembly protein TadD
MRRTLAILLFIAGLSTAPLLAQGIAPAQEQYVNAFLNSRKAEELEGAGDLRGSLKTLRSVADTLSRLKQAAPDFQPDMVEWRLKRTMEAIERLQGKVGGAPEAGEPGPGAPEIGVLPPLPVENPLEPVSEPAPKVGKPGTARSTPRKPIIKADENDPLGPVKNRIATLEAQLSEANDQLAETQAKNVELQQNLTEAISARTKADTERKKAQDLAELYQKNVLELKTKGDTSGERAKELETQLALAKKQNAEREADLRVAEERIDQLLARSRAVARKAEAAGTLPGQVKTLQTKLEVATSQLTGVTKERDDARAEINRLKDLNKDAERLMTDNTSLLKKLADAEKQILTFKADMPKKDQEIAMLRTQVTDAQKALTASQEKNTVLQAELGTVQKKVDEYTKQIQQYKTDKTASVEEKRKMEEENRMLQGIVMRVLQEDANRASRRKLVQKELDRLQIQSDVLLKQIGYLTQPVVNLTKEERRMFKRPKLEVEDPNTLIAFKSDNAVPANPAAPATPPAPETPVTPEKPAASEKPAEPAKESDPEKLPEPAPVPPSSNVPDAPETTTLPKTNVPGDVAKLDTPSKPPLPGKEPGTADSIPDVKTSATGTVARTLPQDIKPIAEQAKQMFDREKYGDAEKLYDKALQVAPTNLYLLSNKAVVQFRMGKLKQAEETFRKALAIAPEDHFCWGTLGIVQYSQNKYDEAVNSLTKSLAINPKNPTAHNYLGITAAQKGWLEAAEKELLTATQLDPKYADAWFNLAVTHTLKQPASKDEGRKAYAKALELGAEPDPAMEASLK